MKSTFFALVLALASLTATARPIVNDIELYATLEKINAHPVVEKRALLGVQDKFNGMLTAGSMTFGSYFLVYAPGSSVQKFTVTVFKFAFAAFIGTKLVRYLIVSPMTDDPAGYQTASQLKYFFGMPIARQYRIASKSPELRRFIMDLSRSLDFADQGAPVVISTTGR